MLFIDTGMSNEVPDKPKKRQVKSYAEGRKKHPTLEEGRKPGTGLNPRSWNYPRKLTPELMEVIIEDVSCGLSPERAFAHVGLSSTVWPYWREKAEKGDEEAIGFVSAIESATAGFELANLKAIKAAGAKYWAANAWLLERTKQDVYALQTKLSGKVELEAVTAKDALLEQAQAKAIANDPNLFALASKTIIDVTPKEETSSPE